MATRALDELAEGTAKGRFGEDTYRRARSFVDSDEEESAPKKQTFKQAFAAARKAGDKKFTWNGKSYTTEVAAAPKPKAPAPVEPAPASYSSREAASDLMREAKRGKTQTSPYGRGAEGTDMYLVKRKAREIEEADDTPKASSAASRSAKTGADRVSAATRDMIDRATTQARDSRAAYETRAQKAREQEDEMRREMRGRMLEPKAKRLSTAGLDPDTLLPVAEYKKGGCTKKYARGGRIDGCAVKGKTRGTMR